MSCALFLLASVLGCVEPPPSTLEGSVEPGGAAKPGAPAPGEAGAEGGAVLPGDGVGTPEVPAPHDGSTPAAAAPAFSQEELAGGVTLSVDVACDGCSGALLVRIEDASTHPPALLTQVSAESTGSVSLNAPADKQVILMVVDDANSDDQPTPGERIGIWTGGLLDTSNPPEGLSVTVGVVPETPPVPPSDEQNNRSEAPAPATEEAPAAEEAPAEG